jgi:hypothetical protein
MSTIPVINAETQANNSSLNAHNLALINKEISNSKKNVGYQRRQEIIKEVLRVHGSTADFLNAYVKAANNPTKPALNALAAAAQNVAVVAPTATQTINAAKASAAAKFAADNRTPTNVGNALNAAAKVANSRAGKVYNNMGQKIRRFGEYALGPIARTYQKTSAINNRRRKLESLTNTQEKRNKMKRVLNSPTPNNLKYINAMSLNPQNMNNLRKMINTIEGNNRIKQMRKNSNKEFNNKKQALRNLALSANKNNKEGYSRILAEVRKINGATPGELELINKSINNLMKKQRNKREARNAANRAASNRAAASAMEAAGAATNAVLAASGVAGGRNNGAGEKRGHTKQNMEKFKSENYNKLPNTNKLELNEILKNMNTNKKTDAIQRYVKLINKYSQQVLNNIRRPVTNLIVRHNPLFDPNDNGTSGSGGNNGSRAGGSGSPVPPSGGRGPMARPNGAYGLTRI